MIYPPQLLSLVTAKAGERTDLIMTALSSTTDWQKIDARHHLAPFTDYAALRQTGARLITHADGHYIVDSDGNRILDAMAGLWCVNVGYGRHQLVDAASQQMARLPY